MRRLGLAAAALLLARASRAAPEAAGPESVWAPAPAVVGALRAECGKASTGVPRCLLDFMARAGASPRALLFSGGLGGDGYLRRFAPAAPAGRVASGEIEYPFRANSNDAAVLLNGAPSVVDSADPALLAPLLDDERLAVFRRSAPAAALWPGAAPAVEPRPGGGQRFAALLPLRACRACADLALARVAFDFDGDGRFLGARLLTVESPPAFAIAGTAVRGQNFEAPVDSTRTFRLEAFSEGWVIEVVDKDGRDYCQPVTPPYHGTNDREIFGWHFRDAGAPGATRLFRCVSTPAEFAAADKSLRDVLWSEGKSWKEIDEAARVHERLTGAAQRGRLVVDEARLGGAGAGRRPWIESMKFRFELRAPGVRAPDAQ